MSDRRETYEIFVDELPEWVDLQAVIQKKLTEMGLPEYARTVELKWIGWEYK